MKKIIYIISIMSILFLTGCNNDSEYTNLSFNELQEKLNNKDSFVLVLGSSTCSACAQYEKTMKKVIKDEKVEIFFLDLNKLSEEEYSKVYSKYVVNTTPTTIFIKEGFETSTYDRIVGAKGYSEIVENLKKHGFVGEKNV